jgi:hypothetical protein
MTVENAQSGRDAAVSGLRLSREVPGWGRRDAGCCLCRSATGPAGYHADSASEPRTSDTHAKDDDTTHTCPHCGGRMLVIETFERGQTARHQPCGPMGRRQDRYLMKTLALLQALRAAPACRRSQIGRDGARHHAQNNQQTEP